MWMKNSYIAPYELGSYNNHAARRDRKLLLNRKEIRALQQITRKMGLATSGELYGYLVSLQS